MHSRQRFRRAMAVMLTIAMSFNNPGFVAYADDAITVVDKPTIEVVEEMTTEARQGSATIEVVDELEPADGGSSLKGAEASLDTQTLLTTQDDTTLTGSVSINHDTTYYKRMVVDGVATLTIAEGATLTAEKGISVTNGNKLTIEGEGTLVTQLSSSENDEMAGYAAIGGTPDSLTAGTIIRLFAASGG